MSTLRILAALALCSAVSVAQAGKDCNELKSEIDARIQAKGAKGYTLDVVASADVGAATVVGSCEGGTRKIVYTRGGGAAPAPAPAAAPAAKAAPAAAPAPAAPAAPAAAKKSSAVQKKPVPTLGNY